MAPAVVNVIGRFLIAILILIQIVFFAICQAIYLPSSTIALIWIVVPPTVFLLSITIAMLLTVAASLPFHTDRDTDHPRLSTIIWTGYVAWILVPNIIVTFGFVIHALEEDVLLGSRVSKRILCITPFLFLLLMNVVDAASFEPHREQMWYLSFQMAIELFDITEMLGIVLDARQQISREFGIAVTAVACFAYLITTLQMEETKFVGGEVKTRYKTTLTLNILQMIGVNVLYLMSRLTLEHGKDNSIFIGISKNVIGILYSMWIIFQVCKRNSQDNHKYSLLAN